MSERELPLDEKKSIASGDFRDVVAEFGLEKSAAFTSRMEKMKGMDHGPNHSEGDPAVHTELVTFELKQFLQTQEHGLSEGDQRLLRLATAVHDIAKADTQKFDVASANQRETLKSKGVQFTDGQVKEAEDHVRELVKGLSGQTKEEFDVLSGGAYKKLKDSLQDQLQIKLKAEAADYPALVANFRDHDREGAKLVDGIVGEAGVELTDQEKDDLKFIVENHMDFMDPEKLNLDNFKKLFVKDGVVDNRKIDLLKIHVYADDKGTYKPRTEGEKTLWQRMTERVVALKEEYAVVLKKERKDADTKSLVGMILPEGMDAYLSAKGVVKGPNFGKAASKVREAIVAHVTDNFDSTKVDVEAIRAEVEALQLV